MKKLKKLKIKKPEKMTRTMIDTRTGTIIRAEPSDASLLRKYGGIQKEVIQYVSELTDNKKLHKRGITL